MVLTVDMVESVVFPVNNAFPGSAVTAEIQFTNNTRDELWVNGRMAVDAFSDPPDHREVWLLINGPEGEEIPIECLKNIRPASSEGYRVLKPGEHIAHREVLTNCFRLSRPGVYTLVAFYQDGNPTPPPPPMGAKYVSVLIQSVPVTFRVGNVGDAASELQRRPE